MKNHVIIHSDGSCWPNPGPGGWAAVLDFGSLGSKVEIKGRSDGATTNNRMEMTAAIEALRYLKEPHSVTLYSDSQYLVNGARSWMWKWARKKWILKLKLSQGGHREVKNADLWREIWRLCGTHNVIWEWVRGHADCAENNRADHLAEAARMSILTPS